MQDVTKTQNAEMVEQTNMKNVCSCVVWVCVEWGIPKKKKRILQPMMKRKSNEESVSLKRCASEMKKGAL